MKYILSAVCGLRLIIPAVLLVSVSNGVAAEGSAEAQRIQLIKVTCHTCHHPASRDSSIPALHSLSADQITALLFAYKNDEELVTIMNRIAKSLPDEDIYLLGEALAADGTR
ncbi:MAG: c-type cytochrome [Gammaproteobacteria bacterium]